MKKIIVMGASSGIGKEVTRLFVQRGCRVGIAARRESELVHLQEEYPGQIEREVIDITQEDAPQRLRMLIEKTGGMDIYLHVSGIGFQNKALDARIETETMRTNVIGFTRMVDEAFNWFKNERCGEGHIAVISSIAGTKGLGTAPAYSASKRLQNHYIDALDQLSRMEKLRIRFSDIRPGFVRTALLDARQSYPMMLSVEEAAFLIVKAIIQQKRVCVIDWRYGLLTALWRMIPRLIWVRIPVSTRLKK